MTYRELLKNLLRASDEHLSQDVTFVNKCNLEVYGLNQLTTTDMIEDEEVRNEAETALDTGHLVFLL